MQRIPQRWPKAIDDELATELVVTTHAPHNGSMRAQGVSNIAAFDSAHWVRFLGRAPLTRNRARAEAALKGKRILITGGGGWIASALAAGLAGLAPSHLVLLEASERGLYEIDSALQQMPIKTTAILGSVCDPALLKDIFEQHQPQIVYHAAAFKHVPLMERNPFAAVENNAIGTDYLVEASLRAGVEQLILLSTDKAVDPVNIMGASKRIAELVLLAHRTPTTATKALRLGNVLESEGSVVPLFRQQIRSGGPVTVTHSEARRYFLTTEDAVTLLLESASVATGNGLGRGILVPDLGEPLAMDSLAQFLIAEANGDVGMVFTELRPGDKLTESLLSKRESYSEQDATAPLRAVNSPALSAIVMDEVLEQLRQACKDRSRERLLQAVLRAVPEYQPSAVMQTALNGERS